jgi:hypothetical protein
MAETNPTPLSIEALSELGGRLFDHAEDLAVGSNFEPRTTDLHLAARACSKFASLRFQVGEVAPMPTTRAITRGDLLMPWRRLAGVMITADELVRMIAITAMASRALLAGRSTHHRRELCGYLIASIAF